MKPSERSLLAFSLYLLVMGLVLLLVPELLQSLLGVPAGKEVWIRVVGMLALILAYYYSVAVKHHLLPILRASVPARGSVILFFGAFVGLGLAPPVLLVFGLVDLAAALWTGLCLRSEGAT